MNSLILNKVVPSIRMLASQQKLLTVRFDDRTEFQNIADEEDLRKFPFVKAEAGILMVDETTDPEEIIDDVKIKLSAWLDTRFIHPDYIIIKGIGVIALANHASFLDILFGAPVKSVNIVSGRVHDKIVIVTGGAQGFGGGIAEMLYGQGANVVIADMNEDGGDLWSSGLCP